MAVNCLRTANVCELLVSRTMCVPENKCLSTSCLSSPSLTFLVCVSAIPCFAGPGN